MTSLLILPTIFPMAAAANELNSGDTAWMLTSTALVLFMTLPGLALFYAGLVRAKNVLSILMQCFAIACISSIVWMIVGYSIAFGDGGSLNHIIGMGKMMILDIGIDSVHANAITIPESVFLCFR